MVQIPGETVLRRRPEPTGRILLRKREILNGASRVFRRRGLHASGMRDIAAELGMAVGNLYYYFADKEELLAFVQEDALSGLLNLAAWVRELELPVDQKLQLLILSHVVLLNEGRPGSLAHLEIEALGERFRGAIQARRDRYEQALRELVEEGMASGVFRPVDAKGTALAILGAVNWTVKWFRPEGGRAAREIGGEFAALLVRGLLAGGSELAPPPAALVDEAEKLAGDEE